MEKTERIWLDGKLVPWEAAQVHVLTHTLHYGLGVFEGIRCYQCHDGRSAVFRPREHIDRLYGSAHVLELAMPYPRERLVEACLETVRASRLRECYRRPIVFMGDGEMGLAARPPTRVAVAAWPWGAYLGDEGMKNGIRVKTSSFARFHPNTLLTKSKATGHYVNSILASREARSAGYDEALLARVPLGARPETHVSGRSQTRAGKGSTPRHRRAAAGEASAACEVRASSASVVRGMPPARSAAAACTASTAPPPQCPLFPAGG